MRVRTIPTKRTATPFNFLFQVKQLAHALGYDGAFGKPFVKQGLVDIDAGGILQRIVGSDLFKVGADRFFPLVQNDNTIGGMAFFTESHESDCCWHSSNKK